MDFRIVAGVGSDLVNMMGEIRQALGMEPYEPDLSLYRPFQMEELNEELDTRLIDLARRFSPMMLKTEGYLRWDETTGRLFYPVVVPPEFHALRQKLRENLPPETLDTEYTPQITVGYISALRPNQRDLVERLYFPSQWTVDRFQLESEVKPGKWLLEATYTLGQNA